MPRYINADNLEYEILHTDFEVVKHECKDYESYVNGANCFRSKAKNLINKAPTEDVVPRAEVEDLQKRIANQREEITRLRKHTHNLQQSRNHYKAKADRVGKQLNDVIKNQDKAKKEVAREIFEEIDNIIYQYLNNRDYSGGNMVYDLTELGMKYIGE